MLAICLTAALPWPRKATHGCFHVFAWYRTNPTGMCCADWCWNRQKQIVPTTDYHTDWKNEIFQSNARILTYIHVISYEYGYYGSSRTSVTKVSTRDHTASLFCFVQRTTSMYVSYEYARKYPVGVAWKIQIHKVLIHRKPTNLLRMLLGKPYTTARILDKK